MERSSEKTTTKKAWYLFIVIALVSIGISYGTRFLTFDYDFEKFFPDNDEESVFFKAHRAKFESDNDFLLVAIEKKSGVFDQQFLTEIDQLTTEIIKETPYVKLVVSITNQQENLLLPGGIRSSRPYIDFNKPDLKRDSLRIFNAKELIKSLIAEDSKSICIYIRHTDYISKKKSDRMLLALSKVIERHHFEKVHIAGRTIGQKIYVEKMASEMVFFLCLSAIFIVIFLFITFRSGWGIIIPQIVILLSTLWLVGLMGWFDEPINILLITLPSIMFVVSMSDVIHMVACFLDTLREDIPKREAIRITIKEVGFSAFLTSITTAIGFGSLYFVNIQPVQVFGIVAGIGVMIAYGLTMVLLPILFYLFPAPKYIYKKKESAFWQKYLRSWFINLLKRRKLVLICYAIISIISIVGVFQMKTNNYLMDDLRSDEPIKQDFNFLDQHYGGIRPFELAITIQDSSLSIWDKEVIRELDQVEDYLTNIYGASVKNSLTRTLKVLNRSSHFGNAAYYKVPESKKDIRTFRRIIRIIGKGKYVNTILDSTEQVSRINGNFPDIGNNAITAKNKKLKQFLSRLALHGKVEYKITGTAHLFDKNIRYLSVSLVQGLSVSILLIALIMGFVHRSIKMMIISIIPNLVPLLLMGAIMGFFGIQLKTSTAIIFTIAFGIAYDDTIHFLGRYKSELSLGKSSLYALKTSYLTKGKAMVLSTLILCCGFLMLLASSFMGSFYMGLLLSISLFIALIADLTLLPVLVFIFYKPKDKNDK